MDSEVTRVGIDLDATAPAAQTEADADRPSAARVVAGRYRLREPIGHGGHGVVWLADDRLAGRVVAVKLLAIGTGLEPARVRREVSALRLLRIPGVVRLLDEGTDRGQAFLVMDWIDGKPFPGSAPPRPWSEIAEPVVSLLETVAQIHAAGILHRDLKPGNVLVGRDGTVTVLDFGLSFGEPLGAGLTRGAAILGTPAFLSPEQLLGETITPRTDLYAIGAMLYHTLSGRFPHHAERVAELMRARATEVPAPLASIRPEVPEAVALVIDAMLSPLPADRPRSASDVLGLLRGQTAPQRVLPVLPVSSPGGRLDESALRSLFAGPERLFHLQSDGARALWARTDGVPDRVAEEVTAWVRSGIARWDGARLAIDRDALDRMEIGLGTTPPALPSDQDSGGASDGWERRSSAHSKAARALAPGTLPRLWHLVIAESGAGSRTEIAREAKVLARRLAQEGRLGQAVAVLGEAMLAVRRRAIVSEADDSAQTMLLSSWVEIALFESTPRALDRVLYEICRTLPRTAALGHLEELVRAALARGAGGERALALAEAVQPFADRGLERRRQGLRVLAARRHPLEVEERVAGEVARWAAGSNDPDAEAALAGWMGRLRYRQGRYEESARLHGEAAESERLATARVNAKLNGASSLLEAFLLDEAAEWAAQARVQAAWCRHPYFEARAEWLLRSAAYRRAEALEPDLELCDVVASVGVADLEALVCLNEAAIAWRVDRCEAAAALSGRACRIWTGTGWRCGALLARALAIASGEPATLDEIETLAAEALATPLSGVGIQVLGLLGPTAPDERARWRIGATSLARAPREHWRTRMEILSTAEALECLGAS